MYIISLYSVFTVNRANILHFVLVFFDYPVIFISKLIHVFYDSETVFYLLLVASLSLPFVKRKISACGLLSIYQNKWYPRQNFIAHAQMYRSQMKSGILDYEKKNCSRDIDSLSHFSDI